MTNLMIISYCCLAACGPKHKMWHPRQLSPLCHKWSR